MDSEDRELRQERYKQAKRWQQYLTTNKQMWFDSENLVDVVDYYFDTQQIKKIKPVLKYALDLYPESEELLIEQVRYYTALGKRKLIAQTMEKVVKINASYEHCYELAMCYCNSHYKISTAIELCNRLLKKNPLDDNVYCLMAHIYDMHKQKPLVAIDYYKKALAINSNQMQTLGMFVKCALRNTLIIEVISYLKTLTIVEPKHAHLWAALAYVHKYCGNMPLCEQAADKALNINSNEPEANILKAQCIIYRDKNHKTLNSTIEESLIDHINKAKINNNFVEYSNQENEINCCRELAFYYMDKSEWLKAICQFQEIEMIQYDQKNDSDKLYHGLCLYMLKQRNKGFNIILSTIKGKDISSLNFIIFATYIIRQEFFRQGWRIGEDLYEFLTNNEVDISIEMGNMVINTSYILMQISLDALNDNKDFDLLSQTYNKNKESEIFLICLINLLGAMPQYNDFTINALKELNARHLDITPLLASFLVVLTEPNFRKCLTPFLDD